MNVYSSNIAAFFYIFIDFLVETSQITTSPQIDLYAIATE